MTQFFYESGLGDCLIDGRFFPGEIENFLHHEQKILYSLIPNFEFLIEVGCMNGRYLSWAVRHRKNYLGLNIIPRYIEAGRKTLKKLDLPVKNYNFLLAGAV